MRCLANIEEYYVRNFMCRPCPCASDRRVMARLFTGQQRQGGARTLLQHSMRIYLSVRRKGSPHRGSIAYSEGRPGTREVAWAMASETADITSRLLHIVSAYDPAHHSCRRRLYFTPIWSVLLISSRPAVPALEHEVSLPPRGIWQRKGK